MMPHRKLKMFFRLSAQNADVMIVVVVALPARGRYIVDFVVVRIQVLLLFCCSYFLLTRSPSYIPVSFMHPSIQFEAI